MELNGMGYRRGKWKQVPLLSFRKRARQGGGNSALRNMIKKILKS